MQSPSLAAVQKEAVTLTVTDDGSGGELPPRFLGLSFETSMILGYYFSPTELPLIRTFRTLGIKSLRVGGNAVDDPLIPVPKERNIDFLFNFARAAGVKVIYSFRLKNGNPAESARLAKYIVEHYADTLDCFSIGNEPDFYLPNYKDYYRQWKKYYDAILQAVPDAQIEGPSVAFNGTYTLNLAKDIFPGRHLKFVSNHYYFFGSGEEGEQDSANTRYRFLVNTVHDIYNKAYAKIGAVLAAEGVPYRIDELNSCYNGGAKDSSDTYASTLWALDCLHWWANHHIEGMNFHTGENIDETGRYVGNNYAAFVHTADGNGLIMRPQAYAYLAFSRGAHGRPLGLKVTAGSAFNLAVYAYRDRDGSIYVTLINKSYGDAARLTSVSLKVPFGTSSCAWERMDLLQRNDADYAKTGITLGGSSIDTYGLWYGQWKKIENGHLGNIEVQVAPCSATILHGSVLSSSTEPN